LWRQNDIRSETVAIPVGTTLFVYIFIRQTTKEIEKRRERERKTEEEGEKKVMV
jgi:TRAP-type C4-dicarboxylate transport system permease small subunit